jgi:hypothetical protein
MNETTNDATTLSRITIHDLDQQDGSEKEVNNMTTETTRKTIEELLVELLWARFYGGGDSRLLLINDHGNIIRVADSTDCDTDQFEQQFFGKDLDCVYPSEQLEEMRKHNREELDAKYRELEAEHWQQQVQNIAVLKATLIKKINVLMSRGYVPIGIVAPDCNYTSHDRPAGYLNDKVAKDLLEAFRTGYDLAKPDFSNDDLGTVERARRDFEI